MMEQVWDWIVTVWALVSVAALVLACLYESVRFVRSWWVSRQKK